MYGLLGEHLAVVLEHFWCIPRYHILLRLARCTRCCMSPQQPCLQHDRSALAHAQALTFNKMAPMALGRIDIKYRRVACQVPQSLDVIVDENRGAGGWIRLQVKVGFSPAEAIIGPLSETNQGHLSDQGESFGCQPCWEPVRYTMSRAKSVMWEASCQQGQAHPLQCGLLRAEAVGRVRSKCTCPRCNKDLLCSSEEILLCRMRPTGGL